MEAIILAGGLGTRLQEVISNVPKPLAPINAVPFLDILLEQLYSFKTISKVILAIGYKGDLIIDYYSKKKAPLPLEFSIETTPLGTGGALRKALTKTTGEIIFALNGDSYLDLPFALFLDHHQKKEADLTLACTTVSEGSRYGGLRFDDSFRIYSFVEKTFSPWINGGVYLLTRSLLDTYEIETPFSLEQSLFPSLLKKKVFAYPCGGKFIDIGTKESYFEAQNLLRK